MAAERLIKKYPNRRLYDTESRYITLEEVREMVLKRSRSRWSTARAREDITRNILLQIIMEQESGGEPLFSADVLSTFHQELRRGHADRVRRIPRYQPAVLQ